MNNKFFQRILLTSALAFTPLFHNGPAVAQLNLISSSLDWKTIGTQKVLLTNLSYILPTLNQSVSTYAQNMLGQQVGDGECSTLASEALNYAQAKNFWQLGPTGLDADYVWGTLVATLSPGSTSTAHIVAGDIIQFRNVTTSHKTVNPDGSWIFYNYSYPHHTAIVSGVSGSQISILHQNVNGNKTVQIGTIELNDLTSGTMWVYRPTN